MIFELPDQCYPRPNARDEKHLRETFANAVMREVSNAERKFPLFPVRPVYMTAIVQEECGEAVKEAIDIEFQHKPFSSVQLQTELIQTAAMCYRAWLVLVSDFPVQQPKSKKKT